MIKNAYLLFVVLLSMGSTIAEWRLVDNGDDPARLKNWSVASDNLDHPGSIPGTLEYADDPVASGQGRVLVITNPVGVADFAAHSSMICPLGELAIKDDLLDVDKKQTVYFKLLRPLVNGVPGELDTTIGLMSSAEWEKTSGEDTIPNYFAYSTIVRYGNDGKFGVWDGTPMYHEVSDTAQQTDVWYEVWMVHSHGLNTYEVYLKGGSDFPEQTLVTKEAIIDENTTHFRGNTAHYRVNTFADLDRFLIRPNGGSSSVPKGKDNTYLDDLHIDNDGENLSSPVSRPASAGLSLQIRYIDETLRISWLGAEEELYLETADTLAHPIPWKRVEGTPESDGDHLTIVIEAGDKARFFQLSRP